MIRNRDKRTWPNPLFDVMAPLNLTNGNVSTMGDALRSGSGEFDKLRIKGHLVQGPRKEQVYDKLQTVLNQTRISQWQIIDRSDEYINAEHPTGWKQRKPANIDRIVVHTTDNDYWSPQDVFEYDISADNHITPGRPLPGITYHFMIGFNGDMEKTSKVSNITYHAGAHNKRSIGIAIPY